MFDPPSVTDPSTCSDAVWIYKVEIDTYSVDSPLPVFLSIIFLKDVNGFEWKIPEEAVCTEVIGSYTMNATGVLADLTTQFAFIITLDIECSYC